MAQQPNAILAINSTDRYITNAPGNVNQPVSNLLIAQYKSLSPYSNDFSITAPNALMNGYIEKIIVSQIQLQYNLPTVIPGKNDTFVIAYETAQGSSVFQYYSITIPYGFYTPDDLAALAQVIISLDVPGSEISVSYEVGSVPNEGADDYIAYNVGFNFRSDTSRRFFFPSPEELATLYTPDNIVNILKGYKLFGISFFNNNPQIEMSSGVAPIFLYTPFIDIYSDALTNYQALKDTDSSVSRRKGLLARLYLSSTGQLQFTSKLDALGSYPFIMTTDLNNPKVIKWTPDTAINSLDFQMRDCYGDLLFVGASDANTFLYTGELFNTEFQMTLLCVEKRY